MRLTPTTTGGPDPFGVRFVRVSNDSGEEIPPHALLRVTGTHEDGYPTVGKPNADSLPGLLVNGMLPIPIGGTGVATYTEPFPVAYDTSANPAVGETWGSANGSWLLTTGKSGWRIMGDLNPDQETVWAARVSAGGINTQNVDGTAVEPDTTDVRFDQATYIKAQQLTGPKRTRVFLDLAGLSDGLAMDLNLDVVTSVCAELTLTPQFSAVPGETHLMTGVTGSVALFLHKRNVTLLSGTTIGEETCVLGPSECCTPGPTFGGCARQFPGTISVTMSGATGSCTCFAGVITLEWNPAYGVAGGYEGTFVGCTGTVTVVVYPDAATPTTWTVVWSAGSYTFDSATVSQSWAFVCDPIASGTLTQTVVAGCSGSFSFVVSE